MAKGRLNKNTKMAAAVAIGIIVFFVLFGTSGGGAEKFSVSLDAFTYHRSDLTPVEIKFDDGSANTPPTVSATIVSVKNQGAVTATNVEVLVKDAFNNVLGTCTIGTINVGETKSCSALYLGMYAPRYEHVYVDPNNRIRETDETNNDMIAEF